MTQLNQWSAVWWEWITALSWQLSLLVCLVGVAVWALRRASPRARHALWLLVLLKVFLPTSLSAAWSVTNWVDAPISELRQFHAPSSEERPLTAGAGFAPRVREASEQISLPTKLMAVWMFGVLVVWGAVAVQYARLLRKTRTATDEGPLRVAVERAAIELEMKATPELHHSEECSSPFLCGALRPRIVLPRALIDTLSENELRAVLLHELVHWKHRDTWVGWLQVFVQGVLWFHPLVWWSNRRLRHERESVCDETVLRLGHVSPEHYGETIVRVLTASRGRSVVAGSLVGVFERGTQLQIRLENIMRYEPKKRAFGWTSRVAVAVFALLFLPMAPSLVESDAITSIAQADESTKTQKTPATKKKDKTRARTAYPQIVRTAPAVGASGVDPATKEIRITFDRDMSKGMSWTGGGPEFPPIDKSARPRWIDERTCVLPVKLKKGKYYRLGVNSMSYRNFKDSKGAATPPSAIYFTTKGAAKSLKARLRAPKVVKLEPSNAAQNVAPNTAALRVTFDVPMGEGMSWTGGGPSFPKLPDGKKARWSRDGRTCTLPVTLTPKHDYTLGLNSLSYIGFQSKWGVPLKPVVYKFRTADVQAGAPEPDAWDVLGVRLSALSEADKPRVSPPYHGGLRVDRVRAKSPAAQNKIRKGDILVGLHHWETIDKQNVHFVLDHPQLMTFAPLKFYIRRGDETLFGHLRLGESVK